MPLYEYYCKKCQNTFEVMQKLSEGGKAKCPQCKTSAKKQISAAGFQLKGTGWYKTDYAPKPAEASPKKEPDPKKEEKTSTPPTSSPSSTNSQTSDKK